MTKPETGRAIINKCFDEIDYIYDILYSARSSLKSAIEALDYGSSHRDELEKRIELVDSACSAVSEIAAYIN